MMRRRDLEDVKYEFNGETRMPGPKGRLVSEGRGLRTEKLSPT